MRKRLTYALIGAALAALAVVATASALSAADGNTQELLVSIKPTKLYKKKPTPITPPVRATPR